MSTAKPPVEITIDAAIDWDAPAGYLQCRVCRVIREGEGNAESVILDYRPCACGASSWETFVRSRTASNATFTLGVSRAPA